MRVQNLLHMLHFHAPLSVSFAELQVHDLIEEQHLDMDDIHRSLPVPSRAELCAPAFEQGHIGNVAVGQTIGTWETGGSAGGAFIFLAKPFDDNREPTGKARSVKLDSVTLTILSRTFWSASGTVGRNQSACSQSWLACAVPEARRYS